MSVNLFCKSDGVNVQSFGLFDQVIHHKEIDMFAMSDSAGGADRSLFTQLVNYTHGLGPKSLLWEHGLGYQST